MADLCTAAARHHGESVGGTASRARRWLLVEQPGAWGVDALQESDLPETVADHLQRLSRTLPARVLLLRRFGGGDPQAAGRTVLTGISHPGGGGWLERIHLPSIEALPDLDLHPLSTGQSVGGELVVQPTYLVCTNGKHDACCASYGLPVARAVSEMVGPRLWECSHVGGDRFAGNLVCLPDGIFYGHLDADTAMEAVAAHESGRMLSGYCRGRSALSFAAQAAELLARTRLQIDRLDGLRFLGTVRDGAQHVVRFELRDGQTVSTTVRGGHDPVARMLTCGTAPATPPTHELVDLTIDPGG